MLEFPEDIQDFLCASQGKSRYEYLSSPRDGFIYLFGKAILDISDFIMQTVAVRRLSDEEIKMLRSKVTRYKKAEKNRLGDFFVRSAFGRWP